MYLNVTNELIHLTTIAEKSHKYSIYLLADVHQHIPTDGVCMRAPPIAIVQIE